MGVLAHHYSTMGMCLLWTVRASLGNLYTAERERAWYEGYGVRALMGYHIQLDNYMS